MDNLIKKMTKLEKQVADEKGPFLLFALFLPEESYRKWDILASSPWIDEDKGKAIKYLTKKIQQAITTEELLMISRIIVIKVNNPQLKDIHNTINIEHDLLEIKNEIFFGIDIRCAYFITSQSISETVKKDMDMALTA
ncbi:MAG: hypothetical protein GY749_16265 [Desulfobacteraceae bacterium]|nr:hypothetical protein [Desulfobacteraceae bacterium]